MKVSANTTCHLTLKKLYIQPQYEKNKKEEEKNPRKISDQKTNVKVAGISL